MPKPVRGPRLGGSAAHQKHIIRNLAKELIRHGRIQTTLKKAKTLQPEVERMVTWAKDGSLPARRRAISALNDVALVGHLFSEIGPKHADRKGGYTRVVKVGPRKGDNAMMALIEFTDAVEPFQREDEATAAAETATSSSGRVWGRRKKADGAAEPEAAEVKDDASDAAAEAESTEEA
ncbi:50S ribosomal protein L17 [Stomatohabitans albus]|uniref:50S ribosomal protein L17 n=1 Tax=Stomatohabitans albus TaxID=3110766 RepID=UPI00300D2635